MAPSRTGEALYGRPPSGKTLARLAEASNTWGLSSTMADLEYRVSQKYLAGKQAPPEEAITKRLSVVSTTKCSTLHDESEDDSIILPSPHAVFPSRSDSQKTSLSSSDNNIDYHFNNAEEYEAASKLITTAQRVCDGLLGPLSSNDTDTESITQDEVWFRACSKLEPREYTHTGYKYDSDDFIQDRPLPYVDHTLKQGIFGDHVVSADCPEYGCNDWSSQVSTPSPDLTVNEATPSRSRSESDGIPSLCSSDSVWPSSSSIYSSEDCEHDLEQAKDSLNKLLSDMGVRHIQYPVGDPLVTGQDVGVNKDPFSKYMDENGNFDFFVGAAMVDLPQPNEVVEKCNPAAEGNDCLAPTQDCSVSPAPCSNPTPPAVYTSRRTPGTLGSSVPTTPSYPETTGKRLRRGRRSIAAASCRSASDSQLRSRSIAYQCTAVHSSFEGISAETLAWRQQKQQIERCLATGPGLRPPGHTLAHGPVSPWPVTSICSLREETPTHVDRQTPSSPQSQTAHQSIPSTPQHQRTQIIKLRHDPTTIYQRYSRFHIPPYGPYGDEDTLPSTPDPYEIRLSRRKNIYCNPNERILHYPTPEVVNDFSAIWNTMCLDRGRQTEFGPGCGRSIYGMDEIEEQRRVWRGIKEMANRRDERLTVERGMGQSRSGGRKGRMDRVKAILARLKTSGRLRKD